MKDHVLIIGRKNDESIQIKKQLTEEAQFTAELVSTAPEAIDKLLKAKCELLIMNMESFTRKKVQLAKDLRHLGYKMPVLVLANIIAPNTYQILQDMPSTVLLEKPYEVKDLTGLAEKLIDGRIVKQRIFRRFYTEQEAELELFRGGISVQSRIRNMSKGGAFIEYKGPQIPVGDMLRLNIALKQVDRHYEVNAKVVWSARISPWGDDPGVGVEFVKSRQVYQNLLRKM